MIGRMSAESNDIQSVQDDIADKTSDIEVRLRKFRKEFEKRVKDPSLVSHLAAKSVIAEEKASRLKNLYMENEAVDATKEMLDLVLKSEAPGKWKSFVDSLERADLETSISPMDIVSKLQSKGVINVSDAQLIHKTCQTKGEICSTMILLERMQCRKSPEEWYYDFLDVLMTDHCHVVDLIEPDFIQNPSAFIPNPDQEEIFPLSFMSNVPTEKQRKRMSKFIGKEYRSLAFQLGLSERDLDHIDLTERLQTMPDKITTMLNIWVKNKSSEATFEELKTAMVCVGIDWRSIFSGIVNEVSDA